MSGHLTTWRAELALAMKDARDASDVVAVAPNWESFDTEFDAGYGGSKGPHVLAWSAHRVYFPVVYDGVEWRESAPRGPTDAGQRHVGGG